MDGPIGFVNEPEVPLVRGQSDPMRWDPRNVGGTLKPGTRTVYSTLPVATSLI
jgi:hypothetical protein